MTATLLGRAMVFLRRASLLAGMLAVVAGILGMHIMTGSHSMPASAAGMDMAQVAQASAATGPEPGNAAAQGNPAAHGPAYMSWQPCIRTDAGACAKMSAMGAVCIPSPGNPPLAVPLPGVTPFAANVPAKLSAASATYAYLPGSPSPGELCISRT